MEPVRANPQNAASMNSTKQVCSPPPLTREQILLLNDGSMTLEEAATMFNVDLRTFRAVLNKENILVWNEVDGTKIRIHGRNFRITMYVSFMEEMKEYLVYGWYPFEDVISQIEENHKLTRGFYKLSYKHFDASVGDVLIETDRNWHDAVKYFKSNAYIMLLELQKVRDAGAGIDTASAA